MRKGRISKTRSRTRSRKKAMLLVLVLIISLTPIVWYLIKQKDVSTRVDKFHRLEASLTSLETEMASLTKTVNTTKSCYRTQPKLGSGVIGCKIVKEFVYETSDPSNLSRTREILEFGHGIETNQLSSQKEQFIQYLYEDQFVCTLTYYEDNSASVLDCGGITRRYIY